MNLLKNDYNEVRTSIWVVMWTMIVLLFVAFTILAAVSLARFSCGRLSQSTNIETKYSFFGGRCLVKVNDRFIPQNSWRGEYEQ